MCRGEMRSNGRDFKDAHAEEVKEEEASEVVWLR